MFRQAGRNSVAIVLGLALFTSLGVALAQESADQEVILNAVETEQQPGQAAFDVTAYATVVDASRQPITGLTASDFSLAEDGVPVDLLDASPATQGASIVLVLDTSGSMAFQGKMDAVKEAATGFIQSLSEEDRVGIISFNETDEILQDLSEDHLAAASIAGLITAEPGTGTCLYDAAYKAGILATTAPPGRRAVILLTDGVDELPNAPGAQCSTHSAQDVINLASGGTTRTPIYTIGVGADVNAEELSQIAGDTGGIAVTTVNTAEVGDLFDAISLQLKSQYALSYVSTATSNEQHNLAVTVTRDGSTSVDQRDFILPTPVLLTVTGLAEGSSLATDEGVTVEVAVSGPAEVMHAALSVDGGPAADLTGAPFQYGLDAGQLGAGSHNLTVEVELANGQQLTRVVPFSVATPPAEPTGQTVQVDDDAATAPAGLLGIVTGNVVPIVVGAVVIVALVVLGVVLRARQQPAGKVVGGASGYIGVEDMTRDIFISQPLATLTVRESLRLLPGQPFDVSESVVRLGRGADNDIVVPDEPVSRRHAELRLENDHFMVFDMDSKYGTLVNDQKVGPEGLPLNDGDELSLGTRTRLLFTLLETFAETVTMDFDVDQVQAGSEATQTAQAETEDDADSPVPVDEAHEDASTLPIDETQASQEASDDTRPGGGAQDDTQGTIPLDSGD